MPFWKRSTDARSGGGRVRIFFATDLHGSTVCFRKFLSAARVYQADILVLGGDLTGKTLVPLVPQGSSYHVGAGTNGRTIASDDELAAFVSGEAGVGHYCVIVDADEAMRLASDPDAVGERIVVEASKRTSEWVRLAEERLRDLAVPCLVTGGNDDTTDVLNVLPRDVAAPMRLVEGEVVVLANTEIEVASIGYSNPTPWHTPREVSEQELRRRIDDVISRLDNPGGAIFNFHVPPAGSGLDRCAELDVSTDPPTPVRIGGEIVYASAGSTAVHDVITEYQPLVGLHGHIHESRGVAHIGATTILNPGSEYQEGILRGVVVNIRDNTVTQQFTSG